MSYRDMPDPRPLGVRLALGPLPRRFAVGVATALIGLALAGLVGLVVDPGRIFLWGTFVVIGLLVGWRYVTAIRWSDSYETWIACRPRRRTRATR
jgi:hypothetical protein